MTGTSSIEALARTAWGAVSARADRMTGQQIARVVEVPGDPEEPAGAVFGDDFPVLAHLVSALEAARRGPLADLAMQFERYSARLRWSQNASYVAGKASAALLENYAYAPISSPQAPICLAVPRAGFLLLGPHTEYPDHHHAPREVYLLLTGGAQWRLERGEWFDTQAGDLIAHAAWQYHAMRTADAPMLAFVGWLDAGSQLGIEFQPG